jgi:hypothetical protein
MLFTTLCIRFALRFPLRITLLPRCHYAFHHGSLMLSLHHRSVPFPLRFHYAFSLCKQACPEHDRSYAFSFPLRFALRFPLPFPLGFRYCLYYGLHYAFPSVRHARSSAVFE